LDDSSLHLTVAKWWIPGLTEITNTGSIYPDIMVNDGDTNQPTRVDITLSNLIKEK
jgi:hypothetical protein